MAPRTPSATASPDAGLAAPDDPTRPPAVAEAVADVPAAPARNPDAILFPQGFRRGGGIADRLGYLQRTLGPKLGGDRFTSLGKDHGGRVYSRDVGGGMYLATLGPDDTLLFPKDHDRAGEDRYRWEDQPDGTRHGWLVDEDEASAGDALPDVTAAREAERAARQAAWRRWAEANPDGMTRLGELREKLRSGTGGGFTPEDGEEMDRLYREVYTDPS